MMVQNNCGLYRPYPADRGVVVDKSFFHVFWQHLFSSACTSGRNENRPKIFSLRSAFAHIFHQKKFQGHTDQLFTDRRGWGRGDSWDSPPLQILNAISFENRAKRLCQFFLNCFFLNNIFSFTKSKKMNVL